MQRSALCRSRRELSNESPFSQSSFQIDPNSNEYLLAKIGVDTAENEPLEVRVKIIQYYSFVSLDGGVTPERCVWPRGGVVGKQGSANFGRLVLGCIEASEQARKQADSCK